MLAFSDYLLLIITVLIVTVLLLGKQIFLTVLNFCVVVVICFLLSVLFVSCLLLSVVIVNSVDC